MEKVLLTSHPLLSGRIHTGGTWPAQAEQPVTLRLWACVRDPPLGAEMTEIKICSQVFSEDPDHTPGRPIMHVSYMENWRKGTELA